MMTEKRFTHQDLHYMSFNGVLDLLNSLCDDKELLNDDKERLKRRIGKQRVEIECLSGENDELKEENEYFKSQLSDAINHERTDMGKSVLMQLADNLGVEY